MTSVRKRFISTRNLMDAWFIRDTKDDSLVCIMNKSKRGKVNRMTVYNFIRKRLIQENKDAMQECESDPAGERDQEFHAIYMVGFQDGKRWMRAKLNEQQTGIAALKYECEDLREKVALANCDVQELNERLGQAKKREADLILQLKDSHKRISSHISQLEACKEFIAKQSRQIDWLLSEYANEFTLGDPDLAAAKYEIMNNLRERAKKAASGGRK